MSDAVRRAALIAVVVALVAGGTASAAGGPWATKANAVCRAYLAKAKAALTPQPKTPAQARRWAAKAVAIEESELTALTKIPGRTAAGTKALAAIHTDIGEAKAALAAPTTARFAALFTKWGNDHRPKRAFLAAGSTACG
jgi:hypothetical protein